MKPKFLLPFDKLIKEPLSSKPTIPHHTLAEDLIIIGDNTNQLVEKELARDWKMLDQTLFNVPIPKKKISEKLSPLIDSSADDQKAQTLKKRVRFNVD